MRITRYILWVLLSLSACQCFGQSQDWLPLTPDDLKIKEVPGNPGASAVQLYYGNYINGAEGYEFLYHRIKILSDSGKSHGDIEITTAVGSKVTNLKARTIHPDGSIVEFTGKPFDKTVFKGHGVKLSAKTFTMPEITVGSIIEYKYRLESYTSNIWIMQHDLYTLKQFATFTPPNDYSGVISYVSRNAQGHEPVKKGARYEITWDNMPPFESEANMPPETNYKPTITFYYLTHDFGSVTKFWTEVGKLINDYSEQFIGHRKEIREAAMQAIGAETDPEKKLRLLYDRAQQIKNMSFENSKTAEEKKKEKIKENENLADVVKRGYGDSDDITEFFVGMARAAGFEANMLLASNRRNDFFSDQLLDLTNLSGRVAQVTVNGKQIFLQPGVRYCPYGLIYWPYTSTQALKFDKKGSTWVTVPGFSYEHAISRRVGDLELAGDGSAKGTITVEFQEQEALEHRLQANGDDEASRKKDLEDEIANELPGGAVVKLTKVDGWESEYEPLVAHFTVEMPDYATVAGKRVLMPSFLFKSQQKDAFKHAERKYPVYVNYTYSERDRITVKMPEGFTAESLPERQTVKLNYAAYQIATGLDGKKFVAERILGFNALFVQRDDYPQLKDFMSKVQSGDDQQAVWKTGVTTSAQKAD